MQFNYYGHSCFSVEVAGSILLFDPFITPNALAKEIDIRTIRADYIFISHGHFDHIHDAIAIARNTGATLVAGWEIYNWFNAQGLPKTQPINCGGKWEFEFGTVYCTIAEHSNSLPDGQYGGAACGFAVFSKSGSFYYSGDTALTQDMKLISRYGTPEFAVLPVGDALTMGASDAIELASWLNISTVVGVHFDTFEFIRIDHEKTKKEFEKAGMVLHLLKPGETKMLQ